MHHKSLPESTVQPETSKSRFQVLSGFPPIIDGCHNIQVGHVWCVQAQTATRYRRALILHEMDEIQFCLCRVNWRINIAPLISQNAQFVSNCVRVSTKCYVYCASPPPTPQKKIDVNFCDREGQNLVYESNKPLLSNVTSSQNA